MIPAFSQALRLAEARMRGRPTAAVVTSGLGNRMGGLGVASQLVANGLSRDGEIAVWHHRPHWRAAARAVELIAKTTAAAAVLRPDFVFYEHVDLARIHAVVPTLRGIPYALYLVGEELWHPLDARRRRAIEEADFLVSISQTTIDQARAHNPWLPEAMVCWLGVAPRAETPATKREPIAVIVGRMDAGERRKGHDVILDAWPAIRAAVPAARLVVAGNGNDRGRLEARAKNERLDGVEFAGFIPDADRESLYARASLFLFPSQQEGFGLAPVEAAMAGMAVLGLRKTVMEELFPGDTAALVDAPTPAAIATGAIPLLADPALAAASGARSRQRALEEFLEDHAMDRVSRAFRPLWRRGVFADRAARENA